MTAKLLASVSRYTRLLRAKIPSTDCISFKLVNKGAISRGIALSAGLLTKTTDKEWKSKLTPQQYNVCRLKGTEPPWSGEYLESKGKGIYQCVCCGADLFSSSTKFDSGSGWPSFFDVVKDSNGISSIKDVTDRSYGMVRVEVLCSKCDSHLGHVFTDGPPPTGLRYCINSVALAFKPQS